MIRLASRIYANALIHSGAQPQLERGAAADRPEAGGQNRHGQPRLDASRAVYGSYEPGSQARVLTPIAFQALIVTIRLISAATSAR